MESKIVRLRRIAERVVMTTEMTNKLLGSFSGLLGGMSTPLDDATEVCCQFVEEHPADDNEPVSEEWWVAIGLKVEDLSWHGNGAVLAYLVTQDHPETGEYAKYGVKRAACDQTWGLYLLPGADGFDGREDYLIDVATRGEFRRLMRALKVPLTEPSHATGG